MSQPFVPVPLISRDPLLRTRNLFVVMDEVTRHRHVTIFQVPDANLDLVVAVIEHVFHLFGHNLLVRHQFPVVKMQKPAKAGFDLTHF